MVLSVLGIFLIAILYSILNFRNKFTYVISMYFLSTGLILITSVLYISKLSNYTFSLGIDYNLYLYLSSIKIHIQNISRLYNFGIAMLMLSGVVFIRVLKHTKWWNIFFLTIPIMYFLYINDPDTSWQVYLIVNSSTDHQLVNFLNSIISTNNTVCEFIITFYFLIPFYALYTYYTNTKINMKRKYATVFAFSLFLIYFFIYIVFFTGPLKSIMFSNVDMVKFPNTIIPHNGYIFPLMLTFIVLIAVIAMTLFFKPFNNLIIIRKKEAIRNNNLMNKNVKMVLHIYKNAFLGIHKMLALTEDKLDSNNIDDAILCLKTSDEIAITHLETITKTLNMLKNITLSYTKVHLFEMVNQAINKACIAPSIRIEKKYHDITEPVIYGDAFHLSEMLVNILINTVYAIEKQAPNKPVIKIEIMSEDDFIIMEITDNGCGIEKKALKEIFKPFYSTQPRKTSGGVGLNYVENVIKQHHGDITVKSEIGKYTTFQIALPIYKGE